MLSIDEAIAHAREVARVNRLRVKHPAIHRNDKDEIEACILCAEEHEQLAEWLELLKWYQQGMEDIPSESGVLQKAVYSDGYNKALEDFKEAIDKEDREEPLVLDMFVIEEIAEKLKK